MSITADEIGERLVGLGDPGIAEHSRRFFKTGKGEYGEGDRFLGIRVPVIRKQIKKYKAVSLAVTAALLRSSFHEVRLFSILMLVSKFSKGDEHEKSKIYHQYIENIQYINNWDLIDVSAGPIIGAYLEDKKRQAIYHWAKSANLWERRISIMSCRRKIAWMPLVRC